MNKIWRTLMKLPSVPKNTIRLEKPLMKRPFTIAFKSILDEDGRVVDVEWIGSIEGVKTLADFPGANCLNIVHKNNKTTVVK